MPGAEGLLRQRQGIVPLRFLDDHGRVGELVDIARMVGMDMRERDKTDRSGLHAENGKRRHQGLAAVPGLAERRDGHPVRERREAVGDPGVPEQTALAAVMNKIAMAFIRGLGV